SPVAALSASSVDPAVTNTRAGSLPSPGQNPTPRRDTWPAAAWYSQTVLPVAASSASTLLPPGTYITPPTTSGVASDPPRSGLPPGAAGSLTVQACRSCATLSTVIWVSGEKRVAARSRL